MHRKKIYIGVLSPICHRMFNGYTHVDNCGFLLISVTTVNSEYSIRNFDNNEAILKYATNFVINVWFISRKSIALIYTLYALNARETTHDRLVTLFGLQWRPLSLSPNRKRGALHVSTASSDAECTAEEVSALKVHKYRRI